MGKLLLYRGLPGSGKSTRAVRDVAHSGPRSTHLEADDYMIDDTGKYRFRPDLLPAAHMWCLETARIMLLKGYTVCVSNTFTTIKEMQPYLDVAAQTKSLVEVYKCTGTFGSVHNVPDATLERMKARWETYPSEIVL